MDRRRRGSWTTHWFFLRYQNVERIAPTYPLPLYALCVSVV
jgi:hypothetical protein